MMDVAAAHRLAGSAQPQPSGPGGLRQDRSADQEMMAKMAGQALGDHELKHLAVLRLLRRDHDLEYAPGFDQVPTDLHCRQVAAAQRSGRQKSDQQGVAMLLGDSP